MTVAGKGARVEVVGRECSWSYISGRGCSWSHISGRGLTLVVGCGWSCDGEFGNEVLGTPLEVPGPVVDYRIVDKGPEVRGGLRCRYSISY